MPPHTVKAHGLWDKFPNADNRMMRDDDGKPVKARYVSMTGGLDLGPHHLATAGVVMADPTAADTASDAKVDAVIGMGVLSRFNMAFAKDGTVYVKPNSHFG